MTGMTAEHLQALLDDETCASLLHNAAQQLARAEVPDSVAQVFRMGRLTALKKPNGKVRGIVTGEILRRMVAKTFAHDHATEFEEACAPFQYALSTRAGTECVAHALKALTESDPLATVMSIDGIGRLDFTA